MLGSRQTRKEGISQKQCSTWSCQGSTVVNRLTADAKLNQRQRNSYSNMSQSFPFLSSAISSLSKQFHVHCRSFSIVVVVSRLLWTIPLPKLFAVIYISIVLFLFRLEADSNNRLRLELSIMSVDSSRNRRKKWKYISTTKVLYLTCEA